MVSTDGGDSWSSENNQPTGQFYHIALDDQFPSTFTARSRTKARTRGRARSGRRHSFGRLARGRRGREHVRRAAARLAQRPYGSGYYSTMLRWDNSTGQTQNVSPWAKYMSGLRRRAEGALRLTHPVMFSPANPSELFASASTCFRARTKARRGKSSAPISRATTRAPKARAAARSTTIRPAPNVPRIASLAFTVKWRRDLGRLGRRVGARHQRPRRELDAGHAAAAAAVGADQVLTRRPRTSLQHGISIGQSLPVGRFPSVYLQDDGLRWDLDGDHERMPDDHYVHVVRESPRERAALRGNACDGLRQPRRRRELATAYAQSARRPVCAISRSTPARAQVANRHARPLVLDPRQSRAARSAGARPCAERGNRAALSAGDRLADACLRRRRGDNEGENPAYGATVFFKHSGDYVARPPLTLSFQDASERRFVRSTCISKTSTRRRWTTIRAVGGRDPRARARSCKTSPRSSRA